MNNSGARPHGELDCEALARGDRVAADVLVELCRSNRIFVLEPDVFAALRVLFTDRARVRDWEVLLAQLGSAHVDVRALKRALRAADEVDAEEPDDDDNAGNSQAERLLAIADRYEYFCNEFSVPYMSVELPLDGGGSRLDTIKIRARKAKLFSSTNTCLRLGSRLLTRPFVGFSIRLRPEPHSAASFTLSRSGTLAVTAKSTSIVEPRTGLLMRLTKMASA